MRQPIYDNEEEEASAEEMKSVVFTMLSIAGLVVAFLVVIMVLIFR